MKKILSVRQLIILGAAAVIVLAALFVAMEKKAPEPAPKPATVAAAPVQLSLEVKAWKGDFDQMLERRVIRVLVPYSRTLYYVDKGHERGLTAGLVRDFEHYLNKKYAKQLGKRPLTVYIIPTARELLLPNVMAGLGDIAAGNLTATDERRKVVDFVEPVDGLKVVRELIVTGPKSPQLASLDDLSGKTIHVRKASSYHESVLSLNKRLQSEGKKRVRIVELPDALEDEDVLEMLNAGLLEIAVVDDWKASIWAQVLPKIKVREDLVLRAQGHTGWAVRKGSPGLIGEGTEFYNKFIKRHGLVAARQAQIFKRVKQIGDNTAGAEAKRFEAIVGLFEKYGAKYGFDPLMLAAQGFQESRLKQEARSRSGAIGVMQILPSTGKDLRVGDISQLEPNIHGGAKYLDQLLKLYFPDAKFSDYDRPLFAFASYNCGPGNVSKMRKLARERGLDPDKWFNNVEIVVSEKIGLETTTYVRNIFKYYAAYRLTTEARQLQSKAREAVTK